MADSFLEMIDELDEAARFSEELLESLHSTDPDSEGTRIRKEVFLRDEVGHYAFYLITHQFYDYQEDIEGKKFPVYSPYTIRKKITKFGRWDALNYRNYDTGLFYNEGIELYLDDITMDYGFKINYDVAPYFQYIPEERIGLNPSNNEDFFDYVDELVKEEMLDYYNRRMDEYYN